MKAWMVRLPGITELTLVVLAAWLVAGWLLPSADKAGEQNQAVAQQDVASLDMKLILDTPLFGDTKKAAPTPALQAKLVTPSRLKIKLLGTVVADDKSAAVVVMQRSKGQQLFFVGDVMKPGVILQEVEAGAIIVDNQGKLERILLHEGKNHISFPAPSSKVTVPQQRRNVSRRVSRSMLDRQLQNFPQLLSQARVIPHFNNGKSDGFLISEIAPGSLYEKVGLQNGDIIRKVNGTEITGPEQAMAMFQNLQSATSINVEIRRSGSVQQVHYDIQ